MANRLLSFVFSRNSVSFFKKRMGICEEIFQRNVLTSIEESSRIPNMKTKTKIKFKLPKIKIRSKVKPKPTKTIQPKTKYNRKNKFFDDCDYFSNLKFAFEL